MEVAIDVGQTNLEAARICYGAARLKARSSANAHKARQSQYINNRIEQDHRRIKHRIRLMLGFKSDACAANIVDGIELIHVIRKGQFLPENEARNLSLVEQFNALVA